jgi:small-conductance mechanosensitive channel
MLVALAMILLLGGSSPSAAEQFTKQLDQLVGKQLTDSSSRTEAKAAAAEMTATLKEFNAKLKTAAAEIAKLNEEETTTSAELESAIQSVADARAGAFEKLVASRAKLRKALSSEQWDGIVVAAAKSVK